MKTSEEIIIEKVGDFWWVIGKYKPKVLEAMDEYANQFKGAETAKIMQVIHSLNIDIVSSDWASDQILDNLSEIMRKTLEKHNLLSEYQNYVKLFGNIPEF